MHFVKSRKEGGHFPRIDCSPPLEGAEGVCGVEILVSDKSDVITLL